MKDRNSLNYPSASFPSGGSLDVGRQQSLRIIRKTATALIALGIGTAALVLEDPLAPLAVVSASVVDALDLMPGQATAQEATPAMAMALRMSRPAHGDGVTRLASAAASEPADRHGPEAGDGAPDVLMKQFVAWAERQDHEQDAQQRLEADAVPQMAPQPIKPVETAEDVPVQVAPYAMAAVRDAEQLQRARAFRSARAELPPARSSQTKVQHAHQARAKTVENAHAQAAAARNAQRPSLLQALSWRS